MNNSNKYVVNNIRQRNYLYSLGLDYITSKDKFDENKEIWLFDRNEHLEKAIDFYCKFRYDIMNRK